MNFLAHLYLSGEDHEIMIGNFIADFVKGKSYTRFSPKIQQGILLHRKIDDFTDKHKITKELSLLLKSRYNRHSGIVLDIFYDHFLCLNWSLFSNISLELYIRSCHRLLLRNLWVLPSSVKGFLPVLITRKRLLSYSHISGIGNALHTMSKYTSLPDESMFAIEVLEKNYSLMNERFLVFFSELNAMVVQEISIKSELI